MMKFLCNKNQAVESQLQPTQLKETYVKAVAVFPGQPNSAHLADMEPPEIHSVPDGRGVLVRVLRMTASADRAACLVRMHRTGMLAVSRATP